MVDAFSLYQVAQVCVTPSTAVTTQLLRDKWMAVFGPPKVVMSDGGKEYCLEGLMRTFGVFHDVVPPTAKWRMSLVERHGAVLKVLMMKIIREKSVIGLDEVNMAATSATSSRNQQGRIGGYSSSWSLGRRTRGGAICWRPSIRVTGTFNWRLRPVWMRL